MKMSSSLEKMLKMIVSEQGADGGNDSGNDTSCSDPYGYNNLTADILGFISLACFLGQAFLGCNYKSKEGTWVAIAMTISSSFPFSIISNSSVL